MHGRQDFAQLLTQLYMKADFKIPPFSFQVGDRIFLSYLGRKAGLKKKKFVTDFDGVFEAYGTEPLYKLFFRHLHDEDINPEIEPEEIFGYVREMFKGKSSKQVFAQIRDYLKSKDLTREQYYLACKRAAKEWEANKEAWQTVNEIRKMGYDITIISGSPQETLQLAAGRIGVEEYEIIGTRFEFDGDRLKEIYGMLGEEKLEQKRRAIGEETHIAATDDMYTDYLITFGAELSIIIADKDKTFSENEKDLFVYDKSIRRDFSSVARYIKKFEYASLRSLRTSEIIERRILRFVQLLKAAVTKKDFLYYLRLLRFELEDFDPFFSSEMEQTITEYEITEDKEKEKRLMDDIEFTLQQVPEYNDTKIFIEALG